MKRLLVVAVASTMSIWGLASIPTGNNYDALHRNPPAPTATKAAISEVRMTARDAQTHIVPSEPSANHKNEVVVASARSACGNVRDENELLAAELVPRPVTVSRAQMEVRYGFCNQD
jgi:hypothetical protein